MVIIIYLYIDIETQHKHRYIFNWLDPTHDGQSNPPAAHAHGCKLLHLAKLVRYTQNYYCFFAVSKTGYSATA